MFRWIALLISHGIALVIGFALGVYFLPILTAPPGPDQEMVSQVSQSASYSASFQRDLKGSDFLHWGEGTVSVGTKMIVHQGALSPGPDYKLYLTTEFVEDEAGFEALKEKAALVGDIKTFGGFTASVPESVNVENFTTAVVWCETFGEFITAAKYQ